MGTTRMVSVDYMLSSIAAGDGRGRSDGTALTRYYTADGYPPGRWMGAGLTGLADGVVKAGAEVTASHLRALFEQAVDPITGAQLGKAPAKYRNRAERIAHRTSMIPTGLPPDARAMVIEHITVEERQRTVQKVVAGFDLTFSVPKSLSALWAVADHGVQAKLYDAHLAALTTVFQLVQDEVVFTRTGTDGARMVRTQGLLAAAFDHWDSRDGDPQLHTHLTVANRVQGEDGKWRTLDSRTLYRATVAYSETYNIVIADEVSRRLGVGWDLRERGRGRRPGREIEGVSDALITAFSGRSAAIEPLVDAAVDAYVAKHGKRPNSALLAKIREQYTLQTRSAKHATTLAQATGAWRSRAEQALGMDPGEWAKQTFSPDAQEPPVFLRFDDLDPADIAALATTVVHEVSSSRSTWTRWNLTAEAMRQLGTAGWQMTDPGETVKLRDRIVEEAQSLSMSISPAELAHVPDKFRDVDGTSQFSHVRRFTSKHVLAAEDRLLALQHDTTGPAVNPDLAADVAGQLLPGKSYALGVEDQAPAAITIATSGRRLDVLVGPAGTGKTTSMAGIRAIHEAQFGPGSVVGLAPSAKAAQVLADDLGIITDNTAQWIAQQQIQPKRAAAIAGMQTLRRKLLRNRKPTQKIDTSIALAQSKYDRWTLKPGQLLIVDEAGMVGTFVLDSLATQVAEARAKLLLVGDPHQLSAVETGGAFGLLTATRQDTPTLTEVRRFTNPDGARRTWEERAAAGLRVGDEQVLTAYTDNARINSGDTDAMVQAAYTAWQADTLTGAQSLLIAADNATVHTLNQRARTDLVAAGVVDDSATTSLQDGSPVGRGDRIVTREIDRFLADGTGAGDTGRTGRRSDGFVRNGQQWHVAQVNTDGSLIVQLLDASNTASSARVCLPAAYVARSVDLAYATTCHRAQGMTVDSAYTIVTAGMNRALLYVAMTRGRRTNEMMVSLDPPTDGALESHQPQEDWTEQEVLHAVLGRADTNESAHQTIASELEAVSTIAQLGAEYESIASVAHEDRIAALLDNAVGPAATTSIFTDDYFPQLAKAVRAATNAGLDIDHLLPTLAEGTAPLTAATLADAVRDHTNLTTAGKPRTARQFIAGIIPTAATGITDPSMRRALAERQRLINDRAEHVLDLAVTTGAHWLAGLPAMPAPAHPTYSAWRQVAKHVAAYRDRWAITSDKPLGPPPATGSGFSQQGDYRRINQTLTAQTTLAPVATVGQQWASRDTSGGLER